MRRRGFLKLIALGFSFLPLKSFSSTPILYKTNKYSFNHGVASGDPNSTHVILWTRVTPKVSGTVNVMLEISKDIGFDEIIYRKKCSTNYDNDYCVKYDFHAAKYISPREHFYFRFIIDSIHSDIGRSKLLDQSAEKVNFSVFSCSNYPAGFFHAYEECSKEDIDFWIHLGDYIYEYGQGGYGTETAERFNRVPEPKNELFSLSDYRKRHAQYKSDKQSKLLHAMHPLVAVWDDHEVSNDTWKYGAENHSLDEGNFVFRKANAMKAYFEWMPIRLTHKNHIYRSFNVGTLLNLMILDTRHTDRDKQIEFSKYFSKEGFKFDNFYSDLNHTARKLIGNNQLEWLESKLKMNSAKWNVVAQQVLMTKIKFPDLTNDIDISSLPAEVKDYLPITKLNLPSNLDAWDGYPAERERIFKLFKSNKKTLISLAGDTHNSWVSKLHDLQGEGVGFEFGTPSVTSPGLLDIIKIDKNALEDSIISTNNEVRWMDAQSRGFLNISITKDEFVASFKYVNSVHQPQSGISSIRKFVYKNSNLFKD